MLHFSNHQHSAELMSLLGCIITNGQDLEMDSSVYPVQNGPLSGNHEPCSVEYLLPVALRTLEWRIELQKPFCLIAMTGPCVDVLGSLNVMHKT